MSPVSHNSQQRSHLDVCPSPEEVAYSLSLQEVKLLFGQNQALCETNKTDRFIWTGNDDSKEKTEWNMNTPICFNLR